MRCLNIGRILVGGLVGLLGGLAMNLYAGGSGLNTVVVINQSRTNSIELGNYFCERRQVPPENVLRINWSGANTAWTSAEFQTVLLDPLLTMLAARQLTSQIGYVVLAMDIPFQTVYGSTVNSTTAALFYGLKNTSGSEGAEVRNSYAGSEQDFHQARPVSAPGASFLTTMLTAGSLAQAKRLVDQGVNSDGTFPTQTVVLAKSPDWLRNLRYLAFDHALFNTRLSPAKGYSITRTNAALPGESNLLGLQTGLVNFSLPPNVFVPGAMADSMTSFGGVIFGANDHTTLLAFIHAGAAGSYGTVSEPLTAVDKFPSPQNYFYQSRGFTLAECYYQSLAIPYQGLIVGEPLAAPWRQLATGSWMDVVSNATLSGTAQLRVSFSAADAGHPLQQIDLFVDGKFLRTLTNLPPQPGNVLNLNLRNQSLSYVVPANATLASVASNLTTLLNLPANTNATQTAAAVNGDRITLRSLAPKRPAAPGALGVTTTAPADTLAVAANNGSPSWAGSSIGTASSRTTFLTASRPVPLDSTVRGMRSFTLNGPIPVGGWLRIVVTPTNGVPIALAVTNSSASGTLVTLATELVNLINATPALQGGDGLVVEDLTPAYLSSVGFNLFARSPGWKAAALRVAVTGSGGLVINPAAETSLAGNLSNLQPRNHLYITAGAGELGATFPLDTTALPDGDHELTAVAYEGSHVRTQTRTTVPVRIQNSPLRATLTRLDLPDAAPAAGTYHLQVTANTNNVSAIKLFSTGGLLNTISNQVTATFNVSGSNLGVGLHPFYALVETTAGKQYRTATSWVRLVAGP
ncbi:MAG: TIGR03790 family protein [Verrucomicrobia subdivision 3 bacterium]|nr:TIGR03790 family protein [Limisphaerales bacterium]